MTLHFPIDRDTAFERHPNLWAIFADRFEQANHADTRGVTAKTIFDRVRFGYNVILGFTTRPFEELSDTSRGQAAPYNPPHTVRWMLAARYKRFQTQFTPQQILTPEHPYPLEIQAHLDDHRRQYEAAAARCGQPADVQEAVRRMAEAAAANLRP